MKDKYAIKQTLEILGFSQSIRCLHRNNMAMIAQGKCYPPSHLLMAVWLQASDRLHVRNTTCLFPKPARHSSSGEWFRTQARGGGKADRTGTPEIQGTAWQTGELGNGEDIPGGTWRSTGNDRYLWLLQWGFPGSFTDLPCILSGRVTGCTNNTIRWASLVWYPHLISRLRFGRGMPWLPWYAEMLSSGNHLPRYCYVPLPFTVLLPVYWRTRVSLMGVLNLLATKLKIPWRWYVSATGIYPWYPLPVPPVSVKEQANWSGKGWEGLSWKLGGNNAIIVTPSANQELALRAIPFWSNWNSGTTMHIHKAYPAAWIHF